MRKLIRFTCILAAVLALIVTATGFVLQRASRHEPEFYRQALQAEPQQQVAAGVELEQNLLELRNETRKPGHWEAIFTEEQINGWLAVDLMDKFPHLIPKGVEEPRVAIRDGVVRVAARYHDKLIDSIVSFTIGVQLTDEPNTVAVTLSEVRAGALPVPTNKLLDRISRAAQRSDILMRWTQRDGDPVAYVTIPSQHEDYAHREIFVEGVELREGELYLCGRTAEEEKKAPLVAQHSPARRTSAANRSNRIIQR